MEKTTQNYTIKQFKTMVEKGTINFDNPFQRPSGQWSPNNQSLLVDSVITLFVPELWALKKKRSVTEIKKGEEITKEVNYYEIIDGKQRGTTFVDILNDKITMTKLDDFYLQNTGETHNISGLKFSDWHDDVQEVFTGYSLIIRVIELSEDDDEEEIVRDIVTRLNSGVAMAKTHLAYINANKQNKEFIDKMIAHPFMTKLVHYTATQERASEQFNNVMQVMSLLDNIEFTKFSVPVIGEFMKNHAVSEKTKESIEKAFEMFVDFYKNKNDGKLETHKFFNKTHWVSVVRLLIDNNFDEEILPFFEEYSTKSKPHDMYRKSCGAGGTEKSKIMGRLSGLQHLYNDYKAIHNKK